MKDDKCQKKILSGRIENIGKGFFLVLNKYLGLVLLKWLLLKKFWMGVNIWERLFQVEGIVRVKFLRLEYMCV